MSTDIIDTAYGHACCVAIHHEKNLLGAYHAHLVQQVGDAAPTKDEILALGAEVSSAWAMGVAPRCFACGSRVEKGGFCTCLRQRLPFRVGETRAKEMAAKGDKRPAAKFACQDCGAGDTMTAEQLLRANGAVYKLCSTCAREVAIAAKAAAAKVAAAKVAAQSAAAQTLIEAAKVEARRKIDAAQKAYEGACVAKDHAEQALADAAARLHTVCGALASAKAAFAVAGLAETEADAMTGPLKGRVTDAQNVLAAAQRRFDSAETRVEATQHELHALTVQVQA